MKPRVTVIDYGMGNLLSVTQALTYCGAEVALASVSKDIETAERLVLPGVGAFADGMAELQRRRFVEAIRRYAASGRPLLGICLGMQMLLDGSDEFGSCEGLGLIKGWVRKLPVQPGLKLPHIGWSPLQAAGENSWAGSVLDGVAPGQEMYFVHSYYADPAEPSVCLSMTPYGATPFCSSVHQGGISGCQFHPEKSGVAGLGIVEKFLRP